MSVISTFKDRTRFFIYPYFQKQFIAYTASIGVGVVGTFYLAQTYFFWRLYEQGKSIGLEPGHPFFKFLDSERFVMDAIFLVAASVVLSIILFQGLRMSHRIAGPMFNLERYLQQWKTGKRERPLRFRRTDYFQEIAILVDECLNEKAALQAQAPAQEATEKKAS